ncbi:MAG: DUF1887 family protein [Bacteroidales bacterium]|nr:DUF1887 family protein [Bacteroidales bacterium]
MKTLVNIITEDNPIPAYLFIKEKYEPGDRIMYISAKDTEDDLDWLAVIDGVSIDYIDEIVLKNDIDEFKYENICRAVRSYLKEGVHYCVNLAGGTRYMALAVQQVFEDFDSEFFYVNLEDNTIVKSKFDDSIYNNDDYFYPVKYKMSVSEYLSAHELKHDIPKSLHEPLFPVELSNTMFRLFAGNLFTNRDFHIMEILRSDYRGCRGGVSVSELELPASTEKMPIPDIREFLGKIGMPVKNDKLSRTQIGWITGGWFEEYIYYKVKKAASPDDIKLGVHISRKGVPRNNELDVLFMKNNRLFVIECKTGVETERMFSEIVYKACALREALLGVSCYSYIASLKKDGNDNLDKIAKSMDIVFWDYTEIVNRFPKVLADMLEIVQ